MSFISVFRCFDIWGLVTLEGFSPPSISQFPESNNSLARALYKCKPSNSEPTPQLPSLSASHTREPFSICPDQPRGSGTTINNSPHTSKHTEIIQTSDSQDLLPWLFLPVETPIKALSSVSFLLPLPPAWACCFLCSPCGPMWQDGLPPLGNCE